MKRGISLKPDDAVVERIDQVAEIEERSQTQVIDRVLRQWLASQPAAPEPPAVA